MAKIEPDEVYTPNEVQGYLKISTSTMKRLLKKGIIRANKVGGQYRIMGREVLRLISPSVEKKAINIYLKLKNKAKEAVKDW